MGSDENENFEINLGKKRTKQWYIRSLNFVLQLRFQICLVNSIKEDLDFAKWMLNAELTPNSFCSLSSQNRHKSLKAEARYWSFLAKGERPKDNGIWFSDRWPPQMILQWSSDWQLKLFAQSFQNRISMISSLYNYVRFFNWNKSLWCSRF